ncbi:hypothetical protein QFC21_002277 [Naganishia friedmannii]|uniref:Uncharacterized protein n=1 Tax=Naganishia friedmannii TaxID=89922 RepID=A0ACC2VY60_9TREE|nr:hypothetical protein QFC21_002277 [Naganishia friedmannii]
MNSTIPAFKPSGISMIDVFSPTSHPSPYLLGLVVPICIIAFITHSLANHQRKRQSSLSLRYDDSDDDQVKKATDVDEKTVLKSRLSELRSVAAINGNPVTGTPALGPSHTANGKKIWENDPAYLACWPDLTRIAHESKQEDVERMKLDKVLYWKLQNLEDHPDSIDEARRRLLDLFNLTLSEASAEPASTILSIPSYTSTSLQAFLNKAHMSSTSRYEAYLTRRKQGGPREMFPTKQFATEWLRLAGVVKYVDGGWLSGVLDIASGRAAGLPRSGDKESGALERKVGKMAWQVISEEFGDGDLTKNHVYVYERLLESLGTGAIDAAGKAVPGYERGFDGLPDDQGAPRCWQAAIAQQCIGLLASTREFFPEAIGFNMAYEALPYHLLVTSRELRELGIDDYYFALHVTIDNADSGHAAIARVAVERYLEGIRKRDGQEAMEKMWRRVQAGYILAEGLPTTPCSPKEFAPSIGIDGHRTWRLAKSLEAAANATTVEKRLVDLLGRKAFAAEKMHCPSRMTIEGQTIEEWLDPHAWNAEKGLAFVRALGEKKPWIYHGDPSRSKLVKELEWGGRMFGAFSRTETELVRAWIRSLGVDKADNAVNPVDKAVGTYEEFIGDVPSKHWALSEQDLVDPLIKLAVDPLRTVTARSLEDVLRRFPTDMNEADIPATLDELLIESPSPEMRSNHFVDVRKVLPVWLISTSLLELFPFSPTRLATPLGSSILRLLRAQLGFGALYTVEDICAGMDDIGHDLDTPEEITGLWELAEEAYKCQGLAIPSDIIEVLKDVQDEGVRTLCLDLLDLRTRPYAAQAQLLGLTLGFARQLHGSRHLSALLASTDNEEDNQSQQILQRIVREEIVAVIDCIEYQTKYRQTTKECDDWWKGVIAGYRMAVRASEWLLR